MLLRDLGLDSVAIESTQKIQTDYNKRITSLLLWIEKNSSKKIEENVLHHSFEVGEIVLKSSYTGEDFDDTLGERGYESISIIETENFNNEIMKNLNYVNLILSGGIILAYTLDFENILMVRPQDENMMQEEIIRN